MPKSNARVFYAKPGLVYSVEFNGNGWYVFKNDQYGTRVEYNAGPGDAGKKSALDHLKMLKSAHKKAINKNPVKRKITRKKTTRKKAARKKNPEHEVRELLLFAENEYSLQNQFESIIKNLEKKAAKGNYDPILAAKLWKYWIDNAVKEYNFQFLTRKRSLVQNVFTVADRKEAATQMEQQTRDDIFSEAQALKKNPVRKKRAKKNPVGAVKPKGFIVASFAPVYREVVYALDNKGARMDFRKTNAKVWKTQNGAAAAAVDIANGWGEPVLVIPINTSVAQIESLFPGVRKRGKK